MIVEFDIYQSILKPLRIDSEELKKEFLRSQRALTNLGKLDLKIFDTKSSILEVKEYVRVPKLIKELWKHHKVYMRDEVIYRFRIKIEYDEKLYEDIEKDFNINSNDFFEKELLPNEVKRRFYDLQMILNICRVGGFSYGMGFIKTSYGFDRLRSMKLYTSELFEYSMEKKWPNFENLEIRKTWNWYLRVQNP